MRYQGSVNACDAKNRAVLAACGLVSDTPPEKLVAIPAGVLGIASLGVGLVVIG